MSKASEYAEALKASKYSSEFYVNINGKFEINLDNGARILAASEALKLAHWIIDTFGDNPSSNNEG